MKIVRNVGNLDQVLRLGISAILFYISLVDTEFVADPLSSGILAFIAVGNLVVATVRFCPLYTLVGINTKKLN